MIMGPAAPRPGDFKVEFNVALMQARIVLHARGYCRPEGESVSSPAVAPLGNRAACPHDRNFMGRLRRTNWPDSRSACPP